MFTKNETVFLNKLEGVSFHLGVAEKLGHSAALLLGHMINLQKENIPILFNEQLHVVNNFSDKVINKYLDLLVEEQLVDKHELTPEEKVDILSRKGNCSGYGIGHLRCQWCNCKALVLNKHHYPIPRKDGGTETVEICPTCHYEFHLFRNIYKVNLIKVMNFNA